MKIKLTNGLVALGLLAALAAVPRPAWAQTSCSGDVNINVMQPVPSFVGDTVHYRLTIRTGDLQNPGGAAQMTVDKLLYKPDCKGGGDFNSCIDEGDIIAFVPGTEQVTATCVDANLNPVAVACSQSGNIITCDFT